MERQREREKRKKKTRSIRGFALPSKHHNNHLSSHNFLSLKLLPPICAVLLVSFSIIVNSCKFQMVQYTVATYTKACCSICQDDPQLSMPLFVLGSVVASAFGSEISQSVGQACRLMLTRLLSSSWETAGSDQLRNPVRGSCENFHHGGLHYSFLLHRCFHWRLLFF